MGPESISVAVLDSFVETPFCVGSPTAAGLVKGLVLDLAADWTLDALPAVHEGTGFGFVLIFVSGVAVD